MLNRKILRLAPLVLAAGASWVCITAEPAPNITILIGNEAGGLFGQCTHANTEGLSGWWAPSSQEVNRLERRLPKYLATVKSAKSADQLLRYYRQYAGFIRGKK